MNKWVKRSIILSKNNFYLDNLLEIYPPDEIKRKAVIEEENSVLEKVFAKKDRKEILRELIRLKGRGFKFPIENSYVSFLCHYMEAIDKNPKLVNFITEQILKMRYSQLKGRLETPKKASRRIGPMFQKWLKKKFKFADYENSFSTGNDRAIFLNGNDKNLKDCAEKVLECRLSKFGKGIDFIGKIQDRYIIGTAKFITDFGGSQDNQFYEAIRFIKETKCPKNVIKIAIIDGVAWLESPGKKGRKMQNILKNLGSNEFCLSALLLNKFINEEI